MHFDGQKPQENLKPLFDDLIEDSLRIHGSCNPATLRHYGRKRRQVPDTTDPKLEDISDWRLEVDETDPMVEDPNTIEMRRMSGDIEKDNKKLTLNLARWIKFNIYDQGGECEFLGNRLVSEQLSNNL